MQHEIIITIEEQRGVQKRNFLQNFLLLLACQLFHPDEEQFRHVSHVRAERPCPARAAAGRASGQVGSVSEAETEGAVEIGRTVPQRAAEGTTLSVVRATG